MKISELVGVPLSEVSSTATTSMYAATKKRDSQIAQPSHSIRIGDEVITVSGKKGIVSFVNGDDVDVKGTNIFYPNKTERYKASSLKK